MPYEDTGSEGSQMACDMGLQNQPPAVEEWYTGIWWQACSHYGYILPEFGRDSKTF